MSVADKNEEMVLNLGLFGLLVLKLQVEKENKQRDSLQQRRKRKVCIYIEI